MDEILERKKKDKRKKVAIIEICKDHMAEYDPFDYLHTRAQPYVQMRQLTMFIIREKTNIPYSEIGSLFNQNHATVLHACRQMEVFVHHKKFYQEKIKSLYDDINKDVMMRLKEIDSDINIYNGDAIDESDLIRKLRKLNRLLIHREIHRRERLMNFRSKLRFVPTKWAQMIIKFIEECIAPL
jgi:hypothetical protein